MPEKHKLCILATAHLTIKYTFLESHARKYFPSPIRNIWLNWLQLHILDHIICQQIQLISNSSITQKTSQTIPSHKRKRNYTKSPLYSNFIIGFFHKKTSTQHRKTIKHFPHLPITQHTPKFKQPHPLTSQLSKTNITHLCIVIIKNNIKLTSLTSNTHYTYKPTWPNTLARVHLY